MNPRQSEFTTPLNLQPGEKPDFALNWESFPCKVKFGKVHDFEILNEAFDFCFENGLDPDRAIYWITKPATPLVTLS